MRIVDVPWAAGGNLYHPAHRVLPGVGRPGAPHPGGVRGHAAAGTPPAPGLRSPGGVVSAGPVAGVSQLSPDLRRDALAGGLASVAASAPGASGRHLEYP